MSERIDLASKRDEASHSGDPSSLKQSPRASPPPTHARAPRPAVRPGTGQENITLDAASLTPPALGERPSGIIENLKDIRDNLLGMGEYAAQAESDEDIHAAAQKLENLTEAAAKAVDEASRAVEKAAEQQAFADKKQQGKAAPQALRSPARATAAPAVDVGSPARASPTRGAAGAAREAPSHRDAAASREVPAGDFRRRRESPPAASPPARYSARPAEVSDVSPTAHSPARPAATREGRQRVPQPPQQSHQVQRPVAERRPSARSPPRSAAAAAAAPSAAAGASRSGSRDADRVTDPDYFDDAPAPAATRAGSARAPVTAERQPSARARVAPPSQMTSGSMREAEELARQGIRAETPRRGRVTPPAGVQQPRGHEFDYRHDEGSDAAGHRARAPAASGRSRSPVHSPRRAGERVEHGLDRAAADAGHAASDVGHAAARAGERLRDLPAQAGSSLRRAAHAAESLAQSAVREGRQLARDAASGLRSAASGVRDAAESAAARVGSALPQARGAMGMFPFVDGVGPSFEGYNPLIHSLVDKYGLFDNHDCPYEISRRPDSDYLFGSGSGFGGRSLASNLPFSSLVFGSPVRRGSLVGDLAGGIDAGLGAVASGISGVASGLGNVVTEGASVGGSILGSALSAVGTILSLPFVPLAAGARALMSSNDSPAASTIAATPGDPYGLGGGVALGQGYAGAPTGYGPGSMSYSNGYGPSGYGAGGYSGGYNIGTGMSPYSTGDAGYGNEFFTSGAGGLRDAVRGQGAAFNTPFYAPGSPGYAATARPPGASYGTTYTTATMQPGQSVSSTQRYADSAGIATGARPIYSAPSGGSSSSSSSYSYGAQGYATPAPAAQYRASEGWAAPAGSARSFNWLGSAPSSFPSSSSSLNSSYYDSSPLASPSAGGVSSVLGALGREVKEDVSSAAGAVADAARNVAGAVGEKVADAAETVADAVRPSSPSSVSLSDLEREGRKLLDITQQNARNAASGVRNAASDAANAVGAAESSLASRLRDGFRSNSSSPAPSISAPQSHLSRPRDAPQGMHKHEFTFNVPAAATVTVLPGSGAVAVTSPSPNGSLSPAGAVPAASQLTSGPLGADVRSGATTPVKVTVTDNCNVIDAVSDLVYARNEAATTMQLELQAAKEAEERAARDGRERAAAQSEAQQLAQAHAEAQRRAAAEVAARVRAQVAISTAAAARAEAERLAAEQAKRRQQLEEETRAAWQLRDATLREVQQHKELSIRAERDAARLKDEHARALASVKAQEQERARLLEQMQRAISEREAAERAARDAAARAEADAAQLARIAEEKRGAFQSLNGRIQESELRVTSLNAELQGLGKLERDARAVAARHAAMVEEQRSALAASIDREAAARAEERGKGSRLASLLALLGAKGKSESMARQEADAHRRAAEEAARAAQESEMRLRSASPRDSRVAIVDAVGGLPTVTTYHHDPARVKVTKTTTTTTRTSTDTSTDTATVREAAGASWSEAERARFLQPEHSRPETRVEVVERTPTSEAVRTTTTETMTVPLGGVVPRDIGQWHTFDVSQLITAGAPAEIRQLAPEQRREWVSLQQDEWTRWRESGGQGQWTPSWAQARQSQAQFQPTPAQQWAAQPVIQQNFLNAEQYAAYQREQQQALNPAQASPQPKKKEGFFSWLFGSGSSSDTSGEAESAARFAPHASSTVYHVPNAPSHIPEVRVPLPAGGNIALSPRDIEAVRRAGGLYAGAAPGAYAERSRNEEARNVAFDRELERTMGVGVTAGSSNFVARAVREGENIVEGVVRDVFGGPGGQLQSDNPAFAAAVDRTRHAGCMKHEHHGAAMGVDTVTSPYRRRAVPYQDRLGPGDRFDARFDQRGFVDGQGYGRDGFRRDGYDRESFHRESFRRDGFDGYGREGYDRDGFGYRQNATGFNNGLGRDAPYPASVLREGSYVQGQGHGGILGTLGDAANAAAAGFNRGINAFSGDANQAPQYQRHEYSQQFSHQHSPASFSHGPQSTLHTPYSPTYSGGAVSQRSDLAQGVALSNNLNQSQGGVATSTYRLEGVALPSGRFIGREQEYGDVSRPGSSSTLSPQHFSETHRIDTGAGQPLAPIDRAALRSPANDPLAAAVLRDARLSAREQPGPDGRSFKDKVVDAAHSIKEAVTGGSADTRFSAGEMAKWRYRPPSMYPVDSGEVTHLADGCVRYRDGTILRRDGALVQSNGVLVSPDGTPLRNTAGQVITSTNFDTERAKIDPAAGHPNFLLPSFFWMDDEKSMEYLNERTRGAGDNGNVRMPGVRASTAMMIPFLRSVFMGQSGVRANAVSSGTESDVSRDHRHGMHGGCTTSGTDSDSHRGLTSGSDDDESPRSWAGSDID